MVNNLVSSKFFELAVTKINFLKTSAGKIPPRDDHVMSDCSDGSFYVFGGFVNGYRVDELLKFKPSTMNIDCQQLAGGKMANKGPKPRASHASAVFNDHLFIYGG